MSGVVERSCCGVRCGLFRGEFSRVGGDVAEEVGAVLGVVVVLPAVEVEVNAAGGVCFGGFGGSFGCGWG